MVSKLLPCKTILLLLFTAVFPPQKAVKFISVCIWVYTHYNEKLERNYITGNSCTHTFNTYRCILSE